MESLHQDTFKRQAPARTPSDYAYSSMGLRSPMNNATDDLASTPRSQLANRSFSSSPSPLSSSLESLSERLDHIGDRMACKAIPSQAHSAIEEDDEPAAEIIGSKFSSKLHQHRETMFPAQDLPDTEDGVGFLGGRTPGVEAGIWDADPLDIVGGTKEAKKQEGGESSSSAQMSKHGVIETSTTDASSTKSKSVSTRKSRSETASNDPDIFKRLLDRVRYWPEQDRAFSRTVGLVGFLAFMKTPYSHNMTRLGLMGVAACAWPLETLVILRKVATKMGWELTGLRDWWRRELARNNSDDSDSDDFVKVGSVPNVEILEDGMEVDVMDAETFGTSEDGVSMMNLGMKKGESEAIKKQANARARAAAEKRNTRQKKSNEEDWEGISMSEMKDTIKAKVDAVTETLSEAAKETTDRVKADLASTKRQLQHISAQSVGTHEKIKAEFETETKPAASEDASVLFGILPQQETSDQENGIKPSPAFVAQDMAREDAPAQLFGILGSEDKQAEQGAADKGKKGKKAAKKNKSKN
ncbi:hypothetical protein BROUX41_006623 [Berkeleyomyces rouxiae]|uniref:uncharacterized protein n=1 Tax=Berkeleyomyces rouxiae TaxID=2035830 RepID=UPI003B7A6D81